VDHVVISYPPSLSQEDITEVEAGFVELGVPVRREPHPPLEFVAGVEWLLMTAAVLYFGKPYFESFLSAAGKHHYDVLRRATRKCWDLFFGKEPKYKYVLRDLKGNERPSQYSRTFSVVSEASDGSKVKLLIEESVTQAAMEDIVAVFLKELGQHHAGVLGPIDAMIQEGPPLGGSYYLVRVDLQKRMLVPVDAVPEHVRDSLRNRA